MLNPQFFRVQLTILALAGTAVLSACTMGDVMRPTIDVGTTQALAAPIALVPPVSLQTTPQIQQSIIQSGAPVLLVTPNGNVPAPPEVQQEYLQQSAMIVPSNPSPNISAPLSGNNDYEPTQDEPGMLAQLAAMPGRLVPDFLKPGANDPETQCRRELKRIGATFEDISPVGNGGSCGISNPVRVSRLSGGVVIKPAAVLNCNMALAFAGWVKKDVQPAARLRYLSGVGEIQNMSSYSCRTIGNKKGGRLSEHSFGNAIDIGGLTLNNGKVLKVRKPGFFALRESSLLNTIRADACDRFTTVLGPGYNADHADHFHLDLMSRKRTSCE
ncbi:MAG: extensin family protein [Notoacmeibacter sp.]